MATKASVHVERAKAAWPILVHRARSANGPMTYGELSAAIGVHHRTARFFLGVIQRHCIENALPKLQALVVNKQTKVPGGGYLGERGRKSHQREVAAVTAYAWSVRPPKFK